MKKAKKCVFLHVRRELAKNSTQTKKWKKCWVICFQGGQKAGVRGSRNRRNLRNSRNRRNPLFFTSEENSLGIPRKRRNRRNVESYVPKLAQWPELMIRRGVLSLQYKHRWGFSYKSLTGSNIVKVFGFCNLRLRPNTYQKLFILAESVNIN